jgi:uncharacterized glyoxalase superfamily protein PhnB
MSTTLQEQPTTHACPKGMHTVTPHLVCAGAGAAIDFYVRAFGAREEARVKHRDGKLLHGRISIGDSSVMLVDEFPEFGSCAAQPGKGSAITVHLYVDDVDSFVDRAVSAGAKLLMPVQDMFWGDRYGLIEDPYGHRWSVATHQRDLSPEEIQKAADEMCQ